MALVELSQRWSELRRRVEGVGEKMLARTWRTLEGDGIVRRDARSRSFPPRVDDSVSERGVELLTHLLALFGWVVEQADEIVDDSRWLATVA